MNRTAWMVAGTAAHLLGWCDNIGSHAASRDEASTASANPVELAATEIRVAPADYVRVPDEELVDQDGTPVRLRDLLTERLIAVNFVFTTCTTLCSPMTAIFGELQEELGNALEQRVRLVTITLDPVVDTPERLKRYADQFNRQKGWTFLTGKPDRVGRVLDALGGRTSMKESHSPVTLLGSIAERRWTRVDGLAPPKRLAEELRALSQRIQSLRTGPP